MATIQKLPPGVVNKIAAGEVIERPASVVKELMENAVDAEAQRIDVSVEKGGADLIRVADDGCGISADELHLAIESHATSKIYDAEDLFRVTTLGFRGEALASIAEISHLSLRSRVATSTSGVELEVYGGERREQVPVGGPVGTTLEIRNLFFNTPVRRKFMKTTQTEMGHISETFNRIALAHPERHFSLRHNQRVIHDLAPVSRWDERIAALFGRDLAESLIEVESSDEETRFAGYVADPSVNRGNNRLQYLLLNGRYIRDRSLQYALGEAYRGLLLTGRFPIAFLRLEVPPDIVDVNVHPTKLEVRFQDGARLYRQLLSGIRNKFLTLDLTPRASSDGEGSGAHDPVKAAHHQQELRDWATGQLTRSTHTAEPPLARESLDSAVPPFRPFGDDLNRTCNEMLTSPDSESAAEGLPHAVRPPTSSEAALPLTAGVPLAGVQVHNRYLITESEDGVVVIDQHALHERVLYEQIRERVLAGSLEVQKLLIPQSVSLSPAEAAAVLEHRETLARLGISIEPFGGDTVLLSSHPAMVTRPDPAELLRQVADELVEGERQPQPRDLLDELLHMISCKAAVKAGDPLAAEEVAALLQQRHLFQDTHHCPHGRPTALVFTCEELDRRFLRT